MADEINQPLEQMTEEQLDAELVSYYEAAIALTEAAIKAAEDYLSVHGSQEVERGG